MLGGGKHHARITRQQPPEDTGGNRRRLIHHKQVTGRIFAQQIVRRAIGHGAGERARVSEQRLHRGFPWRGDNDAQFAPRQQRGNGEAQRRRLAASAIRCQHQRATVGRRHAFYRRHRMLLVHRHRIHWRLNANRRWRDDR